MKKKCMILLVFLLSLAAERAAGQENKTVSLAQCREWARENYPLVRRYGLIDKAEESSLSGVGKALLPQLAVNAKVSYQSEVTRLPFDAETMSALIPGFNVPALGKDQYQASAEVTQTVWDGGVVRAARKAIRAEAVADRRQLDSELYALHGRVNQLFFGCLLQDELIRRNELLQKEWQINLDRIEAMTENGTANLSDRESVEVELLNARQKAVELEASRAAFGQMLAALTGHSVEGIVLEMPPLPNNNFSVEINRPELRAFEAQSALAEARNRQIDAGLMPRAGAFVQGGYGRPGLNMLADGFGTFYVVGLRLSWNIGKLYTLKSDRSKVGIALKEIDARRETFLFNTRLQLLQEDTEIRKMQALVQSDEEIIRLRTRLKEAAEAKLANGVISVTDLIREINAEDMARQSTAVHRIQQLMAAYAKRLTVND